MRQATERKAVLLRIDPAVHTALQRWASSELRSFNAQVEYLMHKALADAGRPPNAGKSRTDREAGDRSDVRLEDAREEGEIGK
jgi:hypothetical protein